MASFIGHLKNPHMPPVRGKERNIFGILEDGRIFQFMRLPEGFRQVGRIDPLKAALWYRCKQQREGWIPVRISTDEDGFAQIVEEG